MAVVFAVRIFEESVVGPFYMLRDYIFYVHTTFGYNILIGGGDMPPNGLRKNAPWRRNSTSSSNSDACRPSETLYVSLCKISAKSDNRRPRVISILPFYHLRRILGPFCAKDLRVEGTHPHPIGTMRYIQYSSLTHSFKFPKKKSFNSKWRSSEDEWSKFGSKFGTCCPSVKIREKWENFCEFF